VPDQYDVRLERVTKRFSDVVAVDDLSLDIERGEFFSLLGPSGCGKTTTLRMIGGFEEPSQGAVYLGETDVTELPPFRRNVNTVFQNYALFPHLTVFENVAFGLRRRSVPKDEIPGQVARMLDLVELPGYQRRRPSQLSGGQQQRVALARALINHPRVLLLDEPLGALDLKLRKQMQIELKRIQTDIGITFIYVTHDQDEAMTMSDRIAVMRNGRIEQLGSPEELYERPRTAFVAGFLGVSNLLDGRLERRDGELAEIVLSDGTRLRAPADGLNGAGSGAVRVGVRPEKLRLEPFVDGSRPQAERNALAGTILDASYVGVSTQYLVETADPAVLEAAFAESGEHRVLWLPPTCRGFFVPACGGCGGGAISAKRAGARRTP
jgi:spermidine/putrescine transport system ATP-binding protein